MRGLVGWLVLYYYVLGRSPACAFLHRHASHAMAERNTDMLREDDERLAELRRSGALSRVLIPDDHPASRDLCCPFSLEVGVERRQWV